VTGPPFATVMWFGSVDGQWPIRCWEAEVHAMAWLRNAQPDERRHLWKARVVDPVEFEIVDPKPYLHRKPDPRPAASPAEPEDEP